MKKLLLSVALAATMGTAVAVDTTLEDYAYDFVSVGYDITIEGISYHYGYGITAGDVLEVQSGDYTMSTIIDGISRKNRRAFVQFYNENCENHCEVRVSGEIALNSEMQMILTARRIAFIGAGDDNSIFE